jgi:hypothetical protein
MCMQVFRAGERVYRIDPDQLDSAMLAYGRDGA